MAWQPCNANCARLHINNRPPIRWRNMNKPIQTKWISRYSKDIINLIKYLVSTAKDTRSPLLRRRWWWRWKWRRQRRKKNSIFIQQYWYYRPSRHSRVDLIFNDRGHANTNNKRLLLLRLKVSNQFLFNNIEKKSQSQNKILKKQTHIKSISMCTEGEKMQKKVNKNKYW